ncbi:MAG: hypothetical protein ACRD5R_18040 [Candidatus Acidiferrales bacterium]
MARSPLLLASILLSMMIGACGNTNSNSQPPPPVVSVRIAPLSASLSTGETQQFQATVSGTSNTLVTWMAGGVPGGNSTAGTISANGLYTAPSTVPANPSVTVSAVSQADASASASATVTLHNEIAISISPAAASVGTGGVQGFTASVTGEGSSSGNVNWSVNGVAGGNSTLGTIVANGGSNGSSSAIYTAPVAVPSPAQISVTATSVADPSKSATATVTVTCAATNSISPSSASVSLGGTQIFTASFCLPAGISIAWDVNGIAGGNSSLGTIIAAGGNSPGSAATYTAPENLPPSNPVTIHATGAGLTASAAVTLSSNISVSITPSSASVNVGQRKSFLASVSNSSNTGVSWTVNGIANGSATVGEVCKSGSNPCATPAGPVSGSVDYIAPSSLPTTNPVTLTASSAADASKSAIATVTIAPAQSVAVTIAPAYAFVAPSPATKRFIAHVSGTSNLAVTWTVASGVAGQGCAGAACGTINSNGFYTPPGAAPSPNSIVVTATSQADASKFATAQIALSSGPAIEAILPSSVIAGAVSGFPLSVQGVNFVTGSGSAASTILLNGLVRSTTCPSAGVCSMALTPQDVQSGGGLTVQIQNPGTPGALSNPVTFVIVPFSVSAKILALSSAAPSATGILFTVTEPTTAAAASPLSVQSIGFLTGGNNCTIGAAPLEVTRPASGTETVSLCIYGSGLDHSFAYVFSGPPGGDIPVSAKSVTGIFPGTIELDLQISSATLPGLRSLFIANLNNDRAAASGMLEIQ